MPADLEDLDNIVLAEHGRRSDGAGCSTESPMDINWVIAGSLWVDELGPMFGCATAGHVFQFYAKGTFEKIEEGLKNADL